MKNIGHLFDEFTKWVNLFARVKELEMTAAEEKAKLAAISAALDKVTTEAQGQAAAITAANTAIATLQAKVAELEAAGSAVDPEVAALIDTVGDKVSAIDAIVPDAPAAASSEPPPPPGQPGPG